MQSKLFFFQNKNIARAPKKRDKAPVAKCHSRPVPSDLLTWRRFHPPVLRQPGDFVKIFNLQAVPDSDKIPGRSGARAEGVERLSFHLHGGTAYGRGVRRLPDDSPDLRELRR